MKLTIASISAFIIACVLLGACKKTDDISTVKTVPTISIVGDRFITLPLGGTYTEQGATFVNENGQPTNITPDSTMVDVNTPGLYVLNYSRTTESQFFATDVRYVAVTDIPDALDLSGDYLREVTGTITTVTKMSRGLYEAQNFGGSTTDITAYFAQINDSTIVIPEQPTSNGPTSGEDGTVSYAGGDTTISYRVFSSNFGTSIRTFVKQH